MGRRLPLREDMQPLHAAAAQGHVAAEEHLAARGVEAAAAGRNDKQPLHAGARQCHVAVAGHLAARGTEATGMARGLPTAPLPSGM